MLDAKSLARAAETCVSILNHGAEAKVDLSPAPATKKLYGSANPVEAMGFAKKINLLEEVNAFTRALDPRISKVTASLNGSHATVMVMRADGTVAADIRPLVRVGVQVIAQQDGRREDGPKASRARALGSRHAVDLRPAPGLQGQVCRCFHHRQLQLHQARKRVPAGHHRGHRGRQPPRRCRRLVRGEQVVRGRCTGCRRPPNA